MRNKFSVLTYHSIIRVRSKHQIAKASLSNFSIGVDQLKEKSDIRKG
jgi:hypothetical protein